MYQRALCEWQASEYDVLDYLEGMMAEIEQELIDEGELDILCRLCVRVENQISSTDG